MPEAFQDQVLPKMMIIKLNPYLSMYESSCLLSQHYIMVCFIILVLINMSLV